MKRITKLLTLPLLILCCGILFVACDSCGNRPTTNNVTAVTKYQANPYSNNDRIKYSYSYEKYDFYYIYLGELINIPMYYQAARYHSGLNYKYTFSTTGITETKIAETVSQSSETTTSIVEEHTMSKESGQKIGTEITLFKTPLIGTSAKISGELNWKQLTTDTSTSSFQKSTSLTNTVEYATTKTFSTMESDEWNLTEGDREGYYRYTFFSASDVYLYVIRDSETNELYYEFKEYVIPETYFWRLDYSETPSFKKSDATSFELDTSILDNLPTPTLSLSEAINTVNFETNGGNKISDIVSPTNSLIDLPEEPTRSYCKFLGWYLDENFKTAASFPFTLKENVTLYAKWNEGNITNFAGGFGTKEIPYLIYSKAHFENMKLYISAYYLLINECLDLGMWVTQFDFSGGNFDGGGNTIKYVQSITSFENNFRGGLFNTLNGATVSNLKLDVNISKANQAHQGGRIGGLAGRADNNSTITKISVVGTININNGDNTARTFVGGIVGAIHGGTIDQCKNSATIITSSFRAMVGGIAGYAGGISDIGNGAAKLNGYTPDSRITISNSYNIGAISAIAVGGGTYPSTAPWAMAGGILGQVCGTIYGRNIEIVNCYNDSTVYSTFIAGGSGLPTLNSGGLVGNRLGGGANYFALFNCYWDPAGCPSPLSNQSSFTGTISNSNFQYWTEPDGAWSRVIWGFGNGRPRLLAVD